MTTIPTYLIHELEKTDKYVVIWESEFGLATYSPTPYNYKERIKLALQCALQQRKWMRIRG
jgi:hypothetical protein